MIDPGPLVKACMAAFLLVSGALVPAASARTLISDTEIEATIGDLARPLLDAAGLDPGSVRILVIGSNDLNAFVAGGQNLFLFTGLIMRTENPGQLSGVLAHEIGHIASGHLVRTSIAVEDASVAAILGLVLGTTAAVISGRADAAAAVLHGTSSALRSNLFAYTRTQEAAADQAAVRLLDSVGQSSRGYTEFLRILDTELSAVAGRPAFATTHPLTPDRIAFAEQHLANSPHADAPVPVEQVRRHARMIAKLRGFLLPPEQTLRLYPADNGSVAARYARAIATFRKSGLAPALALIDGLIAGHPDDGYFRELKGQLLFESGRPREAHAAYLDALRLLEAMGPVPATSLEMARIELALGTADTNRSARRRLERVVRHRPESAVAWRQLAIAQGRTGTRGLAALSLAEEALLGNRRDEARRFAERAQHALPTGSPGWVRAEDILHAADRRE